MEWLRSFGALVLCGFGFYLGRVLSRVRSRWWSSGAVLGLGAILLVAAARRFARLEFLAPFCWLMAGRREFALLGFAIALVLATLLFRLRTRRERILLGALTAVAALHFSILPFLVPALLRARHSRLQTRLDENGVCLQSAGYTCGPAAAVTALHMLGIGAEEGELAVEAGTAPQMGTDAGLLCAAMRRLYGGEGLVCEYRSFGTLDDVEPGAVVLASVKNTLMSDHYVALFSKDAALVTIGDPAMGLRVMPREKFERMWRFTGIVLKRAEAGRR